MGRLDILCSELSTPVEDRPSLAISGGGVVETGGLLVFLFCPGRAGQLTTSTAGSFGASNGSKSFSNSGSIRTKSSESDMIKGVKAEKTIKWRGRNTEFF